MFAEGGLRVPFKEPDRTDALPDGTATRCYHPAALGAAGRPRALTRDTPK
jgi:hypothetical protein